MKDPTQNGIDEDVITRPTLLKDTLTLSQGPEPSLVDMYHDLMLIAEKITAKVKEKVDSEVADDVIKGGDETTDDGGDTTTDNESDAEDIKQKSNFKLTKSRSELDQLMGVLQLHKQPKQHLIIKRAILLNFEEKLFGNNNITMTIDLRQLGEESKDGKLERILKCRDLSRYIPKELTGNGNELQAAEKAALREVVSNAQSPTDILKALTSKTPKNVAVNLILQQYNIRWNTSSGEAKPFDFYTLPKHLMKGKVRKAHTQTVCYEHKSAFANLHILMKLADEETLAAHHLCPPLAYLKKDPYAKPGDEDTELPIRMRDEPKYTWQNWRINNPEPDTATKTDLGSEFPAELSWISPKVKTLIRKLCEPVPDDFNPETTSNVMYLLVINNTSSTTLLENGGYKSQIYIGGADEGLKDRFLGEDGHCNRLMDIRKHFSDIEYFVPHPTALLVELRLLLALARKEQHALFVLKVSESPRGLGKEVHELIIQALYLAKDEIWGPSVNMLFGLNLKEELKKKRKFLPDSFPGSNRKDGKKKK